MKAGKRITTVIPSLGGGGAERNLLRVAESLAMAGYHVTVLTLDPDTPDFYEVPASATRVRAPKEAFLSCRWFDISCQKKRRQAFRDVLIASRPDLVLSFIDSTNINVLQALKGCGIPIIVSERIDWRHHPIGWRWNLLRRLHYARAASVVVLTDESQAIAKTYWPRWNVKHIPNPILPVGDVSPEKELLAGQRNIVAIGRLCHQKGFDLLIEAFAACAGDFPDWNLTIIGEGPLRAELEQSIKQLALAGRVSLPGTVKPPQPVLKSADLFVLSSRYEGFPNTLGEAMACGLPVISFDCSTGPAEIVRHELDGILVPAENVELLEKSIRRMMSDDVLRKQYGTRATEVVERFSLEATMSKWVQLVAEYC